MKLRVVLINKKFRIFYLLLFLIIRILDEYEEVNKNTIMQIKYVSD